MADPRFYKKSRNFTVSEIAEISACRISKGANPELVLDDVSSLKEAGSTQLSFLDNIKYKSDFLKTKAGACFVNTEMVSHAPKDTICLISDNPYKSYALAAQAFYPRTLANGSISETAVIEESAQIGIGSEIGCHVYIGENVIIGENTIIKPNTVILSNVKIGNNCHVGSNVTLSHALIGDYVSIYTGVRVGQDGFGFAIDPDGHVKVPQLGRVLIEDHVEIGANTTIDRGSGPDTIIGQGTWIDNLVQIGHNVQIGRGCVIVAQVGISGSTKLQDYVVVGGQVGIAGHLNIGIGTRIGAQAGVISDIPAGQEYLGSPAMPKSTFFRQVAALNRLIKKKKKD